MFKLLLHSPDKLYSATGVGNLVNLLATFSRDKVPACRHLSSGPKRKDFARNSGLFSVEFIAKTKEKSSPEIKAFFRTNRWRRPQKKGFRQEIKIISVVYCCISIIEKRKKVAGREKCLGGPHPTCGP